MTHGAMAGFNPRPRMGGDGGLWPVLRSVSVSIHAPAWGATVILQIIESQQMKDVFMRINFYSFR